MALSGKSRSKVRNLVPKSTTASEGAVNSETKKLLDENQERLDKILQSTSPVTPPKPNVEVEKTETPNVVRDEPVYSLPAIRGLQGEESYYTVNIPLRLLPKLLPATDESVPADMRAQRTLNQTRVKKLTNYITSNSTDYTLPALTISMRCEDTREQFIPASDETPSIGTLHIPMDMQFLVNDGQHRRAAVIEAIKENADLKHHSIPAMLFIHKDMAVERKRFHVLNAYTSKPAASINKLYDEDNSKVQLARRLMKEVEALNGNIELEKGSISGKSNKLWAFVNFGKAIELACEKVDSQTLEDDLKYFFDTVTVAIKPIHLHSQLDISGVDLRNDYVVAHGVFCEALGIVFNCLYRSQGTKWKTSLKELSKINWKRVNKHWQLRCVVEGKMKKTTKNIRYTATGILESMGVKLERDWKRFELDYKGEVEESA